MNDIYLFDIYQHLECSNWGIDNNKNRWHRHCKEHTTTILIDADLDDSLKPLFVSIDNVFFPCYFFLIHYLV